MNIRLFCVCLNAILWQFTNADMTLPWENISEWAPQTKKKKATEALFTSVLYLSIRWRVQLPRVILYEVTLEICSRLHLKAFFNLGLYHISTITQKANFSKEKIPRQNLSSSYPQITSLQLYFITRNQTMHNVISKHFKNTALYIYSTIIATAIEQLKPLCPKRKSL